MNFICKNIGKYSECLSCPHSLPHKQASICHYEVTGCGQCKPYDPDIRIIIWSSNNDC